MTEVKESQKGGENIKNVRIFGDSLKRAQVLAHKIAEDEHNEEAEKVACGDKGGREGDSSKRGRQRRVGLSITLLIKVKEMFYS